MSDSKPLARRFPRGTYPILDVSLRPPPRKSDTVRFTNRMPTIHEEEPETQSESSTIEDTTISVFSQDCIDRIQRNAIYFVGLMTVWFGEHINACLPNGTFSLETIPASDVNIDPNGETPDTALTDDSTVYLLIESLPQELPHRFSTIEWDTSDFNPLLPRQLILISMTWRIAKLYMKPALIGGTELCCFSTLGMTSPDAEHHISPLGLDILEKCKFSYSGGLAPRKTGMGQFYRNYKQL